MKQIEVVIKGKAYPCNLTMGAMMRFEEIRGKSVNEMDDGNVTDSLTYLHCCVKAGCDREGRSFDMTVLDLADALDPVEFRRIVQSLAQTAATDEKKSPKKASR